MLFMVSISTLTAILLVSAQRSARAYPARAALKVRAAQEGRTLPDYVPDELRVAAGRPTMSQWLHDVAALPPPADAPTPAAEVNPPSRRNRAARRTAVGDQPWTSMVRTRLKPLMWSASPATLTR